MVLCENEMGMIYHELLHKDFYKNLTFDYENILFCGGYKYLVWQYIKYISCV